MLCLLPHQLHRLSFFPVTFFAGVSKYLFTDLALGVVLSIFASYIFAMTVVPLYCSQFIHFSHGHLEEEEKRGFFQRFERKFNHGFRRMLDYYEVLVMRAMRRPGRTAPAATP